MAAGKLSDRKVKALREPGRYGDGATLYLVVAPGGSKQWVQRLTVRGKQTDIGLGGYPVVGLKEAREKAQANRTQARSGADPLSEKRKAAVPTFRSLAAQHIEALRPSWRNAKHAAQWGSTLAAYAYPLIGNRPVDQITRAGVIGLLSPIWTKKPETARRVRQRISAVMKWAIANNFRSGNPAGEAIDAALPRTPRFRAHHRALHYTEVPAVIGAVRSSGALPVTRLSLEFLVLTAARSGEVRLAAWEEMDPKARTWVISAGRMKAGREHRVPLPDRALAILEEAQPSGCWSGLVFPAASGKPLSNMTHGKLLRKLGLDCVPHGFRSSFRDWASEQTDTPHAVMEAALAHTVPNAVEAAYARSDLFDRRRDLMDAWEAYLAV
jgi:integrase